jgi:thioesterase domain-containing protein
MIGPKRQWRYLRFKGARGIWRIRNGLWGRITGQKKRMQEYLSYQQRVVDAAMKAWYRYIPSGQFHGDVTVFREGMGFSDLYARYNDPQYGWGKYIDGIIHCILMDCSHLDLFTKPHVTILGEKIEQCLRESLEKE